MLYIISNLEQRGNEMSWQDLVTTVGLIFFIINTFPVFKMNEYPPISTSLPYGVAAMAFAVVFASYGNWISVVLEIIFGFQWLTIAGIKFSGKK